MFEKDRDCACGPFLCSWEINKVLPIFTKI